MRTTSLPACYAEFIVFNVLSTTHGVEFAAFFLEEHPYLFRCDYAQKIFHLGVPYPFSECEPLATCSSLKCKENPDANIELYKSEFN